MAATVSSGEALDGLLSWAQQPKVIAVTVTLVAILIATRLFSEIPPANESGAWIASTPGYWVPWVGHVPNMAWDGDGFLGRMRDQFPQGIFSLRIMGQTVSMVHKPALATGLMNKSHDVADETWITQHLAVSNFGHPSPRVGVKVWDTYKLIYPQYKKYLSSGEGLNRLIDTTVRSLKNSAMEWITFNSYPSDQSQWERLAEADVVESSTGETFVEADLVALTKNFVAYTAIPSLMGTDFLANFPEFPEYIWAYDAAFVPMAMKVFSWLPWPRLQRARIAGKRAFDCLWEFNEAMEKHAKGEDPGHRWQDLDNVSELMKARSQVYRENNMRMAIRASNDWSTNWAMSANSSPLVFWMLLEICRDPILLEQIRDEVKPYVKVIQPKNDFGPGVWVSPEVETIDVENLVTKCPLLKSAYVETLRLYTGTWTIKWVVQDTTIKESGKSDSYLLKKGTYAVASHELHQFDPDCYPNPDEWHGARHVKEAADENGNIVRTADLGTIRPYGGGDSMCKGRAFAMRELIMYTAVLLTIYDICPPEGKEWVVPGTVKQAATKHPKDKVPVWIRRRKIPETKE